jgi:hypothetical protein
MKLIPALLPICALLLPGALRAEAVFEGKVTMSITGDAAAKSGMTTMTYTLKPGFMRVDVPGAKGFGGMIMDLNAKQMTILMPQQQMYMVRDLNQDDATRAAAAAAGANGSTAANFHPDFTNTGEKTTILGYTCTKLIVKSDKSTAEIWVTDQLGSFGGMTPGSNPFGGGRGAPPPAWVNALKGVGFFPLRVVATESNGKVFKLEVTAIDKGSEPDSQFQPPAGWRKFDLGAMMGGGGFPGARPPSAGGSN